MKIAWVFPQNKKCGISLYAHAYKDALKKYVDIVCIDPDDFFRDIEKCKKAAGECRLVHIQYETSFFMKGRRDRYFDVCASIPCPIAVTLHEVYDQFPGVYPRREIAGPFPLGAIKRFVYDRRHPLVTALSRHTAKHFCADTILVHWAFQREILARKGLRPETISLIPFPVGMGAAEGGEAWDGAGPVRLAATGFISESYDYDLLLDTLALCNYPWQFTWIGGVRRPDDRDVLERLEKEIRRRNWNDRFTVTGWVDGPTRDAFLRDAHIYVALFKYKSSSESLSTALAAGKIIVATSLDLTREMTSESPIMLLSQRSPKQCAAAIKRLVDEAALRRSIGEAVKAYARQYSPEQCAGQLSLEYERMLHV